MKKNPETLLGVTHQQSTVSSPTSQTYMNAFKNYNATKINTDDLGGISSLLSRPPVNVGLVRNARPQSGKI